MSDVRRSTPQVVSFPAIDSSNRPQRLSGLTFSTGDTKLSKDGAAFANTTNNPAEIGSTGRYQFTLTAAEMDTGLGHVTISKTGMDDVDIIIVTDSSPSATVVSDAGNTSSTFKTSRTETTDDYWKDCLILFTTGSLAQQIKKVSAYNGTTKFITISTAFTAAPSASDRFILINN